MSGGKTDMHAFCRNPGAPLPLHILHNMLKYFINILITGVWQLVQIMKLVGMPNFRCSIMSKYQFYDLDNNFKATSIIE